MNRRVWIIGSLLALQPALALAAQLTYVFIDGIPGHVSTAPYVGWHYVRSFNWSYQKSNTAQPFRLQAAMDQHSASFATIKQTAFNGASIKRIVFDHKLNISTGQTVLVARVTCENAAIGALSFSAQDSVGVEFDIPTVQLEFSCTKLLWEDFEYAPGGTLLRSAKGETALISK